MKPTTFYVIVLATAASFPLAAAQPADAQSDAPASNHAPEAAPTAPAITVAAIAATLNSAAVAGQIRNATRETRDEIFTRVEMNLENSGRSLRQLRDQGRALKRENRDHYNAAVSEVRLRERALRESLKSARRATAEQASAAHARLAADYEAYALAVATTESAVNGSSLNGQLNQ